MDNFLLEAVVAETAALLTGSRLEALRETPSGARLLVFELRQGIRRSYLLVDVSGGNDSLHPTSRPVQTLRASGGGFTAMASRRLTGAVLAAIVKIPADRIVTLRFEGAGSLVAELTGTRARLRLLDTEGSEVGAVGSPGGRPVSVPRVAGTGLLDAPPGRIDEAVRTLEAAAHEERSLAQTLRESFPDVPPAVARDIEDRVTGGETPRRAIELWTNALRSGRFEPTLYSTDPPDGMPLDRVPGASTLFALPRPLAVTPQGLVATRYGSAGEAAETLHDLRARARTFVGRRDALVAIARRESLRLGRLTARLDEDLRRLDPPGRQRHRAEAILAGLSVALREGDQVTVPDPYDPEGGVLSIRIDPSRTLQQNAEALFRRERKTERGRREMSVRLAAAGRKLAAVDEVAATIAAAADEERLARAEAGLREIGIMVVPDRKRKLARRPRSGHGGGGADGRPVAAAPASADGSVPVAAGVRAYRSSDGIEILVGRTGRDNDRLTFQMTSPDDFWFHAAGVSGAHVVVRNPDRLPHLPAPTQREAAALAAYFSKASGSGKVEVHATRCKHVRKARRSPPGTVVLKKHTSLVVPPGLPPGASPD